MGLCLGPLRSINVGYVDFQNDWEQISMGFFSKSLNIYNFIQLVIIDLIEK
jgi:hypothetical protein